MAAGNRVFQRKEGAGWSRGLDNLLAAELGRWFRTRKWWIQIVVWAALVNLILVLVIVSEDVAGAVDLALLFTVLLSILASIGVCILMQGVIVEEKQSGTAAWILSKPVSRAAFILAKLIANTVGVAAPIVLVQGLIAYGLVLLASGTALPPLGFLGSLGVILLHLLFYLTLTLMLGSAFSRRGPVVAVPLVWLFAQELLPGVFPVLVHVLPLTLTIPLDDSANPSVAMALLTGAPPLSWFPLATTLAASVGFVAIALWIFQRLEF